MDKPKILHKFAHYQFEMEIHPNDDPEELQKDLDERNLDPPY
jgi:hypothetical protein